MNEKFKAIDLRKTEYEGKFYYKLVCYSSLCYLIKVSLTQSQFEELSKKDYSKLDCNNCINKFYNEETKSFRYSLKSIVIL